MRHWTRRFLRRVIVLLIVAFALLIFFRIKFGDTIRGLAETQVKNTTSDLINDAVDKHSKPKNVGTLAVP